MNESTGNGYVVEDQPGDGILLIHHYQYGRQIWSLRRLTKKNKGAPCALCGKLLGSHGYAPIGNPHNRAARICATHRPIQWSDVP